MTEHSTAAPKNKPEFVLDTLSDFKAWALQERNAHCLLKEILFRWRGSTIRARGSAGIWTVYPRERWIEWTGLSRDQVKRALRTLEIDGFIHRERHRFGGSDVRSFVQPTLRALQYAGRPHELETLKARISSGPAPISAPTAAPTNAPTSAPTGAPTDYTSFPSSTLSPSSSSVPSAHACSKTGEVKGSAGGETTPKKKLKIGKPAVAAPTLVPDDADPVEEMAATLKAKQLAKALAKYPVLHGPHEKGTKRVKHPSEMYPDTWVGFSNAVKADGYLKYKTYVDNWYAKHGGFGKGYASGIIDVDTIEIDWNQPDIEEQLYGKAAPCS